MSKYQVLPLESQIISRTLEEVARNSIVELSQKLSEPTELAFMPDASSRNGGPIVHIPQSEKWHEHDVLTHLDLCTAQILMLPEYFHFYLLLHGLNPDDFDYSVLLDVDNEILIAAMLHDVEKIFFLRQISEDPRFKSATSPKYNTLESDSVSEDTNENEYKYKIFRFLFTDDTTYIDHPLNLLKVAIEGLNINNDKLYLYLKSYGFIDGLLIKGTTSLETMSLDDLLVLESLKEPEIFLKSIGIMISDILSQGIPVAPARSFFQQKQKALNFCFELFSFVNKTYEQV